MNAIVFVKLTLSTNKYTNILLVPKEKESTFILYDIKANALLMKFEQNRETNCSNKIK